MDEQILQIFKLIEWFYEQARTAPSEEIKHLHLNLMQRQAGILHSLMREVY